jgi:hypothetical protein
LSKTGPFRHDTVLHKRKCARNGRPSGSAQGAKTPIATPAPRPIIQPPSTADHPLSKAAVDPLSPLWGKISKEPLNGRSSFRGRPEARRAGDAIRNSDAGRRRIMSNRADITAEPVSAIRNVSFRKS